ncbi:MAG: hypothetical protein MMC33_006043 [Icmadophila ericetorum]|nr:hypothetical protein [Icmadophila ericetorum]
MAGQARLAVAKQQDPGVVQASLPKNMKRKREDSEASDSSTVNHRRKNGHLSYNGGIAGTNFKVEVVNGLRKPDSESRAKENNVRIERVEKSEMGQNSSVEECPAQDASKGTNVTREAVVNNEGRFSATQNVNTMAELQEAIEGEFSLEILLKHNELRLIDQEIAKCQVALEQLRRCQIRPYPVLSDRVDDILAVSQGIGPPLQARLGQHSPSHPPPQGVTDGPYTRHYAKWLIPDYAFNGALSEEPRVQRPGGKHLPERSTRGSKAEKGNTPSLSRSHRGSTTRLQALPAGYPEPKEEKGPMIVKRSTDGAMVKLVCLDCRRENFNSAQGFINHCRIAHGRGFASHDAAALACGEEVEYNEAGGMIGDASGSSLASAGLVHPLIRSAQPVKSGALTPTMSTHKQRRSQSTADVDGHTPTRAARPATSTPQSTMDTPLPQATPYSPFVPSPNTPHLSALFARSGLGLDLDGLVNETTRKTDIPSEESSEGEDEDGDIEMENAITPNEQRNLTGRSVMAGRLPTRTTMSPAPLDLLKASWKGLNTPSNRPQRSPNFLENVSSQPSYSSPYSASFSASNHHNQRHSSENTVMLDDSPPLNLSPHTVESNVAPSLVSDDGDYEAHSESEAPSSAVGDEEEDRFMDIEVQDEENRGGPSTVDPELAASAKARTHVQPTRRSSALRSPTAIRSSNDGRHVTFASPTRSQRRGERRKRGTK